ncbi:transcription factor Tfb2 [Rhizodiscina lignyota]|uniref:RNA polymerase II transcription factor B subunit 2 n=1 Tax=Rhizodiscina lignyota TaxID=1504668 RepID=A0A9P4IEZ5_9PEZI|nr:transcription factor Tfb2 [Rhizodiscina lignyota]
MTASMQALEYLEQQSGATLIKLYRQPSSALAIFRRMLPHLAKNIVMAMLYMTKPFSDADLLAWIRPDALVEKDQAMSVLERLHIISKVHDPPPAPTAYQLSDKFAKSLRQALTGGGNHRSFGVPCSTPDPDKIDVENLDKFARQQWEAILYYMVGSAGGMQMGLSQGASISDGTKMLLEMGNFVERKGGRPIITQTGFSFLLQEANTQVWSLLIVYLESADNLQMDKVDVLSFLFTLGSLELGQDYSTANLTATQLQMLDDLSDFGIVYRRDNQAKRFYPTRLATTLTSDAGALLTSNSTLRSALSPTGSGNDKGYIIVETNYRLYAYTSSILQIAVLALFTRLHTRFPNLVSGKLTKESIQRAINLGITADQVISYLTAHAHPQMAKNTPVMPPTVVDQIRLWQIEGDRMKATTGFLIKEFGTQTEYDDTWKYADSLGVLVWKNDIKRLLFVSRIEQLSTYLAGKKSKARAA